MHLQVEMELPRVRNSGLCMLSRTFFYFVLKIVYGMCVGSDELQGRCRDGCCRGHAGGFCCRDCPQVSQVNKLMLTHP
jgi:hypothetical protein